jgi:catechol 2,3-dioxygenase-like lactoylglutathione lyase family enzyme
MAIQRMDHVSVVVDDLEAAIAFFVHTPTAVSAEPKNAPANTLGLRSIMFVVDDIDATVAGLRAHGAELVGEVAQYQDSHRLCYVRGPEGIIVALAEQLG